MKFLYWGPYTGFVGTIQGMVNSAASLREHGGQEVTLVRAYQEWQEREQEVARAGLQIADLGLRKRFPWLPVRTGFFFSRLYYLFISLFAPRRLAKLIDETKPDCLVACLLVAPMLKAVALATHKPKTVAIIWGYPNFLLRGKQRGKNPLKWLEGWLRKRLWRKHYGKIDHIAAVSARTRGELEAMFPEFRGKTFLMRVPVAQPRLLELAAQDCPHPWLFGRGADYPEVAASSHLPAEPVIVAVGRLSYQKGFDTLLRALAQLRLEVPAKLIILGGGELAPQLRALAAALGISDAVELPGFVQNPYMYLRRADAFVLSSRWEDPCHAIIEAGYAGAPIITTDCPSGPADFVLHGDAGEVCAVDDAHDMAAALRRSLFQTGRTKAKRAFTRAQEFTPRAHCAQLLAILGGESEPAAEAAARREQTS